MIRVGKMGYVNYILLKAYHRRPGSPVEGLLVELCKSIAADPSQR